MKTYYIIALLGMVILYSCKKDEGDPIPPLAVITEFTPSQGPVGTSVIVTGQNFSAVSSQNVVKFNNVVATVSAASSTQLTVTVPLGATTGKISVTMGVKTVFSAANFNVTEGDPVVTPSVLSFSPTSGTAGTTVTITGTNFSTSPSDNTVHFNGTAATISAASATQLIVVVPAGTTTGKISVTVGGITGVSVSDFVINPTTEPPTIINFTPTSGVAGNTVVINGTNFNTTPAANTVAFNSIAAVVNSSSATQLTVTVPQNASTGKISVTVNGNTTTSTTDFIVPHPPTITSFFPTAGAPGQTVIITGTHFSSQPELNLVKFNGVTATISAATSTQLTVVAPPGFATGKITVTVNAQTGTSATNFILAKGLPLEGLVAFYPFSGNANDISSNSLHGTVSGATLTADRHGNAGKAYLFNGTNNYILLGNSPQLQISGKITITVWIKASALGAYHIVSKFLAGGHPCKGYFFYMNRTTIPVEAGKYSLTMNDLSGSNYLDGSFQINEWIFLAVTLDGNKIVYYPNGEESLNQGTSAPLTDCSSAQLVVGCNSNRTSSFFNGVIDDLAIYNRALTGDEIKQVYEQTVSQY